MPPTIDFKSLGADLLARSREVLPEWFPEGRFQGVEFVIGDLDGTAGRSLSVNTATGQWADFAADTRGADLISLYAASRGISMGAAAKTLGATPGNGNGSAPRPVAKPSPLGPPPINAPKPGCTHPQHGPPSATWAYPDANGHILCYVARYDTPGGKQYCPWSWNLERKRWVMQAYPAPRPLYGLQILAQSPAKPVLVVEGEKAADAARAMAGHIYAVVTWQGGTNALKHADWSAIQGRKVLLWPDADTEAVYPKLHPTMAGKTKTYLEQPGPAAMHALAAILHPHNLEVKVIDVQGRDKGWDADDARQEGMTYDQMVAWAKPLARLYAPTDKPAPPPVVDASPHEVLLIDLWVKAGLAMSTNGSPIANLDNCVRIVEKEKSLQGRIWWDAFRQRLMTTWGNATGAPPREWGDVDDIRLNLYVQRDYGIGKIPAGPVHDAAVIVGHRAQRNELVEWIHGLKWDAKPRLAQLLPLGFGTAVDPYHVAVGQAWLIGMVARALRPGCKLDTMPVLEGQQGAGKSTALQIIGGRWFTECHESVNSKDFYIAITGNWLIEIAEMHSFGRSEIERVKGIITNNVDRYRSPWGRNAEDHPRMSCFAGTTNRDDWNQDDTGARRFWPVKCGRIDLAWLETNREQLFAEAVSWFKAGATWWEVPDDAAKAHQEARRRGDTWEDVIRRWIDTQVEGSFLMDYVTTEQVLNEALKLLPADQDRNSQLRVAACMRLIGWYSTVKRVKKRPTKVWVPPENDEGAGQ